MTATMSILWLLPFSGSVSPNAAPHSFHITGLPSMNLQLQNYSFNCLHIVKPFYVNCQHIFISVQSIFHYLTFFFTRLLRNTKFYDFNIQYWRVLSITLITKMSRAIKSGSFIPFPGTSKHV